MRQNGGQGTSPLWAQASFAAYLAWNVAWLASGRIPPSVLRALLGLPCPTTGCTRSLVALLHGNLYASLLWNPLTVPILILLAVSLQMLFLAALRKKELTLPKWVGAAWWSVLLMAWLSKFLLGRAYW
ncbi:MAG: DUF2752 domain-containing protein [Candidatus Acidiferrales bacterium]